MPILGRSFLFVLLFTSIFGISGCVMQDKRSVGNIIDDRVIATKIGHELIKNSLGTTSVNVCEGRILLTGYITDVALKDKAEKIAWLVQGVNEVINDIVVTEKNQASTVKDLWIKTKLKTVLLTNKEIHSVNYQVAVYNSMVYLLGIAESQAELDKALKVVSELKGVSEVKNYVIIKNDARRSNNGI